MSKDSRPRPPNVDEDCDSNWDNSITNACVTTPCRFENHQCSNTDNCYYIDEAGNSTNLSTDASWMGCKRTQC